MAFEQLSHEFSLAGRNNQDTSVMAWVRAIRAIVPTGPVYIVCTKTFETNNAYQRALLLPHHINWNGRNTNDTEYRDRYFRRSDVDGSIWVFKREHIDNEAVAYSLFTARGYQLIK